MIDRTARPCQPLPSRSEIPTHLPNFYCLVPMPGVPVARGNLTSTPSDNAYMQWYLRRIPAAPPLTAGQESKSVELVHRTRDRRAHQRMIAAFNDPRNQRPCWMAAMLVSRPGAPAPEDQASHALSVAREPRRVLRIALQAGIIGVSAGRGMGEARRGLFSPRMAP